MLGIKKCNQNAIKSLEYKSQAIVIALDKDNKKRIYKGSDLMEVFDDMYDQKLIEEDRYFSQLEDKSLEELINPRPYFLEMWKEKMGEKPLLLTKENLFIFNCWIEDKYHEKEIADLIGEFGKFKEVYCYFISGEKRREKYYAKLS